VPKLAIRILPKIVVIVVSAFKMAKKWLYKASNNVAIYRLQRRKKFSKKERENSFCKYIP